MRNIARVLTVSCAVITGSFCSNALEYYTKAKASVAEPKEEWQGVYVGTSSTVENERNYSATSEATQTSKTLLGIKTFYLYAKAPIDGWVFTGWTGDKADDNSSYDTTVTITPKTPNKSTVTKEFVANYKPRYVQVNKEGNGTVSISNEWNNLGEEITLTAMVSNETIEFLGWYDKDGNCVSDEAVYVLTVDKPSVLTAKFIPEIFKGGVTGYYRISTSNGKALAMRGAFETNVNSGILWDVKCDLTGMVNNETIDHTDPSQIFYLSGEVAETATEYAENNDILKDLRLTAQGKCPMDYIKKGATEADEFSYQLKWNKKDGYQSINRWSRIGANYNQEWRYKDDGTVGSSNGENTFGGNTALYLQPIDEEHVDKYWFGVQPDEEMFWDNGYWTTMYTAFPYNCLDEVEAYYVSGINDGKAVLEKIEGTVPGYTAVMLKCKNAGEGSLNRLMPVAEAPEDLSDNILKGTFQLNTSRPSAEGDHPGHEEMTDGHRILKIQDGKVVFGKSENGGLLAANSGYLQGEELPESITIDGRNNPTGLSGVSVSDAQDVIYDIYGRRVKSMYPGNIYIVNGKKVLK